MLTFDTLEELVPNEYRQLVFRFFVTFARFEYALKRAGFAKDDVGSAWDSFEVKFRSVFDPEKTPELKAACDYLSAFPPKRQLIENGALRWAEQPITGNVPLFKQYLNSLRRIRNNMFHGGKFPIEPVPDPTRNLVLLTHGLTLLKSCSEFDPQVQQHLLSPD